MVKKFEDYAFVHFVEDNFIDLELVNEICLNEIEETPITLKKAIEIVNGKLKEDPSLTSYVYFSSSNSRESILTLKKSLPKKVKYLKYLPKFNCFLFQWLNGLFLPRS